MASHHCVRIIKGGISLGRINQKNITSKALVEHLRDILHTDNQFSFNCTFAATSGHFCYFFSKVPETCEYSSQKIIDNLVKFFFFRCFYCFFAFYTNNNLKRLNSHLTHNRSPVKTNHSSISLSFINNAKMKYEKNSWNISASARAFHKTHIHWMKLKSRKYSSIFRFVYKIVHHLQPLNCYLIMLLLYSHMHDHPTELKMKATSANVFTHIDTHTDKFVIRMLITEHCYS